MAKRKTKQKNKIYFTEDTEDAIVEYNSETSVVKRNKIYNERIKAPIEKLVENVINTFKFPYIDDTFKNKKADLVSHIILNLDKYSKDKGKAFSYFSVTAKYYLIIKNEAMYKQLKSNIYIDVDESGDEGYQLHNEIPDHNVEIQNISNDKREFIKLLIDYFNSNLTKIFKKKRDIDIASCVLMLMESYDKLENFNKKNLYILVREMSGQRAQHITSVINKMKDIYMDLYESYYNTGELDNQEIYDDILEGADRFF